MATRLAHALFAAVVAAASNLPAEPPAPSEPVASAPATTATPIEVPTAERPVVRVGGNLAAEARWDARRGAWRAGSSEIDTPLPEGYPAPTPPGAIDLKLYPSVRRAEVTGAAGESDRGFWPLFRHIERREIAMTSPVEVDYPDASSWTMAFLYRRPEQGATGTDNNDPRVAIRDTEPMMVLSLGGRGSYDRRRVDRDVETLLAWIEENGEWRLAGRPRALFYNGPSWFPARKWLEVQVPVKRRTPPAQSASTDTEAAAAKAP